MAIVKAADVFNARAGFSEEEVARIGAAAAGRTVSFPRGEDGGMRNEEGGRKREEMLAEYARGKTADELAGTCGMSRRQVFYLLREERTKGTQATKVTDWRKRGLSWREVGRLMGKSHEAVRLAGGGEGEVEVKVEVERGGSVGLDG